MGGVFVPVILRYRGYRFFFFANEGDPREPIHVHVRSAERVAKFWVVPEVSLAESYRMMFLELNELEEVVRDNRDLIVENWNEFFPERPACHADLVQ